MLDHASHIVTILVLAFETWSLKSVDTLELLMTEVVGVDDIVASPFL